MEGSYEEGFRKNKRGRRRGSWIGRKERRGRAFVEWWTWFALKRIGPISTFFFPTPQQIIFGLHCEQNKYFSRSRVPNLTTGTTPEATSLSISCPCTKDGVIQPPQFRTSYRPRWHSSSQHMDSTILFLLSARLQTLKFTAPKDVHHLRKEILPLNDSGLIEKRWAVKPTSYIFDHRSQCGKVQDSPILYKTSLAASTARHYYILETGSVVVKRQRSLDIGTDIDDPMEFEKKGYDLRWCFDDALSAKWMSSPPCSSLNLFQRPISQFPRPIQTRTKKIQLRFIVNTRCILPRIWMLTRPKNYFYWQLKGQCSSEADVPCTYLIIRRGTRNILPHVHSLFIMAILP